jgi:hypothetical protein
VPRLGTPAFRRFDPSCPAKIKALSSSYRKLCSEPNWGAFGKRIFSAARITVFWAPLANASLGISLTGKKSVSSFRYSPNCHALLLDYAGTHSMVRETSQERWRWRGPRGSPCCYQPPCITPGQSRASIRC